MMEQEDEKIDHTKIEDISIKVKDITVKFSYSRVNSTEVLIGDYTSNDESLIKLEHLKSLCSELLCSVYVPLQFIDMEVYRASTVYFNSKVSTKIKLDNNLWIYLIP